jgi:dTDP-4-amino-4,6-dideoxygalactose transaminase
LDFIPFNKPAILGDEIAHIEKAVQMGHLSGNGQYSKRCQTFFNEQYGFGKSLLTTSCTDALEMCALLLDLQPGDEVIMPAYTFVSTANAFVLHGAKIVFVDSTSKHPGMDASLVEKAITPRTKAVVVVHYAGQPNELESIVSIVRKHSLVLIEDAAQAIDVKFGSKYLGTFGDLATFSFHETKNIQCGEGGLLVINNPLFFERAEIIWEKGTNRQAFFKGLVDKYRWVDLGASYLMSDLNAAYLWGQLQSLSKVTKTRRQLVSTYESELFELKEGGHIDFPGASLSSPNGHIFYLLLKDESQRDALITHLKNFNILAVFHYQALHLSPYYLKYNQPVEMPNATKFEQTLLRLPLYFDLNTQDVRKVCQVIKDFFHSN